MMQLKLFELLDNEETLNELLGIFGRESVVSFSDKIIGINYDYGVNSYIGVLQKVRGLNLRQLIVTSSSFINMIDFCVKEDLFINNIKFIYPVPKENIEYVDDYLEKINAASGSEKRALKVNLFKEIDWITFDECIDVKSISIQMQGVDSPIYIDVELYNNGVLLINDEHVIENVKDLLNNIF
ncbi:hypothetical protein AT257_21945 [Bacillus cereus]|nr:hypothetical protein AT257_21945 [Bacillus cereus]